MTTLNLLLVGFLNFSAAGPADDPLPFQHRFEVFRSKEGDVAVFVLRLEQPFLAEEFETSNYLRLQPLDKNTYLVYPKETKFHQKHAEFYGRLRGEGRARLRLAFESVTENVDGSRKVDVRQTDFELAIPARESGAVSLYRRWAEQQNDHFLRLLRFYPDETFLQYCLLQSADRYGVTPPEPPKPMPRPAEMETNLYHVFTGSLAVQESLQRQTLKSGRRSADRNIHISQLAPPAFNSLPYEKLLEDQRTKRNHQPKLHEVAKLVPADSYFLHFYSMRSAGELLDLSTDWGDSLLRLYNVRARDNRLQEKLEDQLCIRRGPLTRLFADKVIAEVAVIGADPFVVEGTDVTFIFRLTRPEVFEKAADGWLAQMKQKHPELAIRTFHYLGHTVSARYTEDRLVSSFVARHEDYIVYSNSHRAIRTVLEAIAGKSPRLFDSLDYRYVSTILPPSDSETSGYLFASEAFLKRLVSPASKISEKRRLECFNNLVMLNNASLFHRLDTGRSPRTLTDLAEGKYVDPAKLVCHHGGAYAWNANHDTGTCSLHNRLKYLTPNVELTVQNVFPTERDEYERYKQRYEAQWKGVFDPIAVRINVDRRVTLEVCVLPFANGSLYATVRDSLAREPNPLTSVPFAPAAVGSMVLVTGQQTIADLLRRIPGVPDALRNDPTLTDLVWVGESLSIHLCDDDTILEVDPARLRPLDSFPLGKRSVWEQLPFAAGLLATDLPVYATIDVNDREKAARLLDLLSSQVFLQGGSVAGLPAEFDAYRLPDYNKHQIYVVSFQFYALKLRLHVALVGSRLVAATKPEILRGVIDASGAALGAPPIDGHALLRLNRRAIKRLYDDLELYWAEKARIACHGNVMSIYALITLFGAPMEQVDRLSDAKYGVVYFCPDHGTYEYDSGRDQVACSLHGSRERSRQNPRLDRQGSFADFLDDIDQVQAALRFRDEALIATIEISRSQKTK